MMKKSAYNAGDPGLIRSLGWEVPLEKGMAPTPVFLSGEFHGQRRLAVYNPWGCKSQTGLSDLATAAAAIYLGASKQASLVAQMVKNSPTMQETWV